MLLSLPLSLCLCVSLSLSLSLHSPMDRKINVLIYLYLHMYPYYLNSHYQVLLWIIQLLYCNLGHLSHGQNNYETIHVMSTSIIDIYLEKYWFCTLEKMKIITKYSLRFVRVALLICENIYVLSGRWRRTEEPDMLQSMGVQRIWQDLVTEQQ